ncbi:MULTISPECIES: ABC transporter ATP-binding protein [Thermococcus]|uniref:Dipeptide transport ATP-binding DppF-like protein n=1 Tax=Thermococcus sibiricus TaxID=172049 RepID=A0A117L1Y3_9EURY|nr:MULTISPECIES: ABC transporter ATP-binding protein [Thermococcus]KUK18578.1 MAG: Dipeptide transport ATP-binding DppF-like protein [Thermococcus sibiricus]KUK29411.1 MAG: Dipeptide transport ATP-binding DppF-like protein [Thermococcus sp. 40_45]MBC7095503.1 ABC transporter ATP-binding protein [Thermococcus sp.]HII66672.1 ABC transporter ATP-binding protein [Thermococcaceae archaeon]
MEKVLEVKHLKKYFPVKGLFFTKGYVKAVDDISFEIYKGETFGLVGESGCGKTTTGRAILRLIEPTSGNVIFKGKDVTKLKGDALKQFRKEAQIMFQDPYSSLNPRQTVFEIIMEPVRFHGIHVDDPEEFVIKLLESVGLNEMHLYRYPHEFSGGQRQRIALARLLAVRPEFIVLDEPTSALDVSVQANILNMLKDLQKEFGFTYLFISHDLGVVKYMSHKMGVMYLGKLVEVGPAERIFENPLHPYAQFLLSAIPIPDPELAAELKAKREKISGEPPSPINPPSGCRFHPRCPYAKDICRKEEPPLIEVEQDHHVACWLYSKA